MSMVPLSNLFNVSLGENVAFQNEPSTTTCAIMTSSGPEFNTLTWMPSSFNVIFSTFSTSIGAAGSLSTPVPTLAIVAMIANNNSNGSSPHTMAFIFDDDFTVI
ncbi:hypothetical protein D3C85_1600180 [compost metagenome]